MPRYDYRCQACGHVFELRQSYSDPPTASCPQCKGDARRLLHMPQVVYKGAGFFTSDQRRSGFGNYWYNREVEADERARKEARGDGEPSSDSGPMPPPVE